MAVFHTPPENQGQIVEVAYAAVGGLVVRRSWDQGNGNVLYAVSEALVADEGDHWNGPPRNRRWRALDEAEADALLQSDDDKKDE